jgi:hypothetical protein
LPLKDSAWACLLGKNGNSGNPGNKLSGHHLSVGNPSVCSQGMPCPVLWSGMLGLGRGGQRQLKFSKAMDSNLTACPHQPSMLNCSLLVKLQMSTRTRSGLGTGRRATLLRLYISEVLHPIGKPTVGSPSVCSQGMPGLGHGGQRQLRFSKAMDSNFTACLHQPSMLPKPCTLCSSHRIELFPKLSDFLDPRRPDPPQNVPNIMFNHSIIVCG